MLQVSQPERVLVVGLNWIGDNVMAMPALQAFRRRNPECHLTILVKPGLAALWELHGAPDVVLTYRNGIREAFRGARRLRALPFDRAFILPHSIRSAVIPFLARVPRRTGLPGAGRSLLVHRVVAPALGPGRLHQGFEYADLLAPEPRVDLLEPAQLILPVAALAGAEALLRDLPRPLLGVLPGAARGPAKRWPADHFAGVARRWIDGQRGGVVLLGGREDVETCARLEAELAPAARSLAGRTPMAVWAAVLKACAGVVANDSGGMHLAAALDVPVAAVFGLTDPARTGPLGRRVRIVQDPGGHRRDIARNSVEAQKRLAAILPERVYHALLEAVGEPAADEDHAR